VAERRKKSEEQDESRPAWLTADYVIALYELRKSDGDEVTLRQDMQWMRDLCDMKIKPNIPEEYEAIAQEVRTPFVKDAWLRVAGSITQNEPVPHIEPADDKDEFKRAAAVGERWTDAAFYQMSDEVGEDVVYEDVKAIIRDREAVVKVVHRPDAWASFPDRKRDETADTYKERVARGKKSSRLPMAWRLIDRKSMLFEDGEFGDGWCIEYGEYPRPLMAKEFRMAVDPDGHLVDPAVLLGGTPVPEGEFKNVGGRCVKVEYWDVDWWAVVVDGSLAPGFPKPNPYRGAPNNGLPYFRARLVDSPMLSLRFLVPALDSLLTMHLNWAFLGAYPNPKLTAQPNSTVPSLGLSSVDGGMPGGEDQSPPPFQWKPGLMITPPPGYDFDFVSPPPIGNDVIVMEQNLRTLIDIAGIPSVLRGAAAADASGYLANQLITAALIHYKQLTKAVQRQFNAIGSFLWWIVEHKIRQEVYVLEQVEEIDNKTREKRVKKTWLSLKPGGETTRVSADPAKFAKFTYRFRPVLPTDEQARAMIAVQVTNAPKPLYSRKRALEKFMQEEDPEGVLDDIYTEEVLDTDPMVHSTVVERALREAGFPVPGQPNPADALVGPQGQPLIPSTVGAPSPYFPAGQGGNGVPAVPGLTQPMQPPRPGGGPSRGGSNSGGRGGRAAGSYPGLPGGVPGGQPR
jgi:hypothetical protein